MASTRTCAPRVLALPAPGKAEKYYGCIHPRLQVLKASALDFVDSSQLSDDEIVRWTEQSAEWGWNQATTLAMTRSAFEEGLRRRIFKHPGARLTKLSEKLVGQCHEVAKECERKVEEGRAHDSDFTLLRIFGECALRWGVAPDRLPEPDKLKKLREKALASPPKVFIKYADAEQVATWTNTELRQGLQDYLNEGEAHHVQGLTNAHLALVEGERRGIFGQREKSALKRLALRAAPNTMAVLRGAAQDGGVHGSMVAQVRALHKYARLWGAKGADIAIDQRQVKRLWRASDRNANCNILDRVEEYIAAGHNFSAHGCLEDFSKLREVRKSEWQRYEHLVRKLYSQLSGRDVRLILNPWKRSSPLMDVALPILQSMPDPLPCMTSEAANAAYPQVPCPLDV